MNTSSYAHKSTQTDQLCLPSSGGLPGVILNIFSLYQVNYGAFNMEKAVSEKAKDPSHITTITVPNAALTDFKLKQFLGDPIT